MWEYTPKNNGTDQRASGGDSKKKNTSGQLSSFNVRLSRSLTPAEERYTYQHHSAHWWGVTFSSAYEWKERRSHW